MPAERKQFLIHGIDLLKAVCAIVMVVIHSHVFSLKVTGTSLALGNLNWGLKFNLLLGFFSLGIPATAGAVLRDSYSKYLYHGRIYNFPDKPLISVCLWLMFIDSMKGLLTFGISHFFLWDVLHLVSVSFMLLTFILMKLNVWWLLGFSVFSVIIYPPLQYLLSPLMILDTQNLKFLSLGLLQKGTALCIFLIALAISLRLANFFSGYRKKFILGYLVVSSLVLCGFIYLDIINNENLLIILLNLPFAAFIGGQSLGGHIWPISPWFSLISAGFLIHHFYLTSTKPVLYLRGLLIISFVVLSSYFYFSFEDYYELLDKNYIFSSKIYQLGFKGILAIICFYGFFYAISMMALSNRKKSNRFVFNLSRGMLVLYFCHYILAYYSSIFLAQHLKNSQFLMSIFPFGVFVFSYLLLEVIVWLQSSRYQINLRKKFYEFRKL